MSARQSGLCSPAVPSPVTNLFVQIDLFVAAEEALAKKHQELGYTAGEGLNPPWTLAFISAHFSHRSHTDHPLLRLPLVGLQQLGSDLNAGPYGPEFYRAVEWINENDSPFFDFGRVCGELEVRVRMMREQIAEIFPQYLRAGGRLSFIHSLVPQAPLPELIAAELAKRQADDRAYRLELLKAHRNRMPFGGDHHPLQMAWSKLVQSRIRQDRRDARIDAGHTGTRPPMSPKSVKLVLKAQALVQSGKPVHLACDATGCSLSAYIRYERENSPK